MTTPNTPAPAGDDGPAQSFGIIDPDYARIFTQARVLAWQYGYACLAHGSFTRDLDLLLVPWADRPVPKVGGVVNRIADVCGLDIQGPPKDKPHGRMAWSLLFPGFKEVRWVDVSAFDGAAIAAKEAELSTPRAQLQAADHINAGLEARLKEAGRALEGVRKNLQHWLSNKGDFEPTDDELKDSIRRIDAALAVKGGAK